MVRTISPSAQERSGRNRTLPIRERVVESLRGRRKLDYGLEADNVANSKGNIGFTTLKASKTQIAGFLFRRINEEA